MLKHRRQKGTERDRVEANLSHKLRDKGFSAVEEKKIMAMRDFIVKQAHAARA